MKTRMKKLLAGMCAVLILPIGSAQTVLAEEPEQNFPISVEKAVNQTLKLWYGSPAKINTAESSGGEWMQQSLKQRHILPQRLKIIENCLMTNLLMYLTMTKVSAVTVWGQKSDFRAKTI